MVSDCKMFRASDAKPEPLTDASCIELLVDSIFCYIPILHNPVRYVTSRSLRYIRIQTVNVQEPLSILLKELSYGCVLITQKDSFLV
jgi:hypothetical protein